VTRRSGPLLIAGSALLVAGIFVLFTVVALVAAAADVRSGQVALERAAAAGAELDLASAREELGEARGRLCSAGRRLQAPGPRLAARWPWVGPDIAGATALSAGGCLVAGAAEHAVVAVEELPGGLGALMPVDGRLPVGALQRLAPILAETARAFGEGEANIREATPAGTGPTLQRARVEFLDRVGLAREGAEVGAALLEILPALLGAEEPRRYVVLAQNPAELRGTGGFMGAFTVMTADRGRLDFGDFRSIWELENLRPDEIEPPTPDFAERYDVSGGAGYWPNLNFTPDFPTVGAAIVRLWERTEGNEIDGVIAVDPVAVEHLMAVTGATQVSRVGTVTAATVVEVMANEAYDLFDNDDQRKALLGAVAVDVLQRALTESGDRPDELLEALAAAVRGRHLLVYARDPRAQEAIRAVGADGGLLEGPGEHVAVVVNSRAANKADYYTDRNVRYEVHLRPDGSSRSTLTVTLRNDTPAEGLPSHVIGPNVQGLAAGHNRSRLDLFAPKGAGLLAFRRHPGRPGVRVGVEHGRPVFTTVAEIPPGGNDTVEISWDVEAAWTGDRDGGSFTVVLQDQPTIRPTSGWVVVHAPPGMSIRTADPSAVVGGGRLDWTGTLEPSMRLEVILRSEVDHPD
jgi:hypothetical protein